MTGAPQRPTGLNGDWRGLREQHGQPAATANGVWRAPRSPMAARLLRPMHSGSLNLWQALSPTPSLQAALAPVRAKRYLAGKRPRP